MNAQIFKKVLEGHDFLTASELTPKEKEILYDEMIKNGSTRAFAYDRFFKEGFKEWELKGIMMIKAEFFEKYRYELDPITKPEKVWHVIVNPGEFYQFIGKVRGLKNKFKAYMKELGMCEATVIKRFGHEEDQWKRYEIVGVRAVIKTLTDK